jgi:hypothetical protein
MSLINTDQVANGVRRPSLDVGVSWISRYLPIPFVERGRSFSGCDCRGLNLLILEHETGVRVPEPEDLYRGTTRRDLVDMAAHMRAQAARWREIPAVDGGYPMFATLLFAVARQPTHMATSLGGRAFIHTQAGYGVTTGDLDEADIGRAVWGKALMGAYVYAD